MVGATIMSAATCVVLIPTGWCRVQVEKVVELGYDLRGIMYWSLVRGGSGGERPTNLRPRPANHLLLRAAPIPRLAWLPPASWVQWRSMPSARSLPAACSLLQVDNFEWAFGFSMKVRPLGAWAHCEGCN